jgi:hypothetical protein
MNNEYLSEKIYLDKIEDFLKLNECSVWREVVPDEHINKKFPFKIDLILLHKKYGYIGVEGKNIRSLRQGSIFAKAIHQIIKYRELHYFGGIKISRWCISTPIITPIIQQDKDIQNLIDNEVKEFIKTFLNFMYNISLLEFKEYSTKKYNRIIIDSLTKNSIIIKNEDNKNDSFSKF